MLHLRQRNAFRFDNDGEHERNPVLDEQEQEEVVERLRRDYSAYTHLYNKFLQGCLSFAILFNCWFLVLPRQITPLHVLIPTTKTPLPPLIPFATCLALLNILTLLNIMLHLPRNLSFPKLLHSIMTYSAPRLPPSLTGAGLQLPLPIAWSTCILCVPPIIAVLAVSDLPQIIWWSLPLAVVGVVVLVRSWIREVDLEMDELEKLKYEAKGA